MNAKSVALISAMVCALIVPAAAQADIVNPVVDFGISCASEGSRAADSQISTPGDELVIHGKVVDFNAPFDDLDANYPTKEHTYRMSGLISQGTVVTPLGLLGTYYETQYTGGTFEIWCDDTPDADATYADKATYTDGDMILSGAFSAFEINTNTVGSGCAGDQQADFQFSGGSLFNRVSDGGTGLNGINTGAFTVCSSQIPAEWVDGCFGMSNTKLDSESPVPTQEKTWRQIKQLFE